VGNVLDQTEVDALMQGVVKGEIETETDIPIAEGDLESYDLTSQDRILKGRMHTLEVINERFARKFRVSLSTIIHKTVDVNVTSTNMMKFEEFINSLPVPTSINIFKMDPLRGYAMFVVESKLVFSMIGYLFGATNDSRVKVEGRAFTHLEQHIIKKVVSSALSDLQKTWEPVHEVDIQYVSTEEKPQFAAIVPPSEIVVLTSFEVEVEKTSGVVNLCLPYSTIEPIRGKLQAAFQSDRAEADSVWVERLREGLNGVYLNMTAEMGRAIITGSDLLKLKRGDIIQLNNDMDDGVLVAVEGVPKFIGTPGAYKGNKGIKIKKLIGKR